ncbi:MAG: hypothetical protein LBG66_05580, partial [Gallionellaceae bacterium]|nr:hypothetical protein [Gallionellaceae bacterium]
HAHRLGKARNNECGLLLPCPKGCLAKAASAALQILAIEWLLLRFAPCSHCLCETTNTMKIALTDPKQTTGKHNGERSDF